MIPNTTRTGSKEAETQRERDRNTNCDVALTDNSLHTSNVTEYFINQLPERAHSKGQTNWQNKGT